MASISRSMASLRIASRRTLAQRYASSGSAPTPASQLPSDPSGSASPAETTAPTPDEAAAIDSGSLSSNDANTSPAPDAPSPPPPPPSNRPKPGMTLWGPTNSYKQSLPDVPRSQQLVPMTPAPTPPWHKGPVGIYHINYPRPLFPTPKKEDLPSDFSPLGGNRQERRMKVLSAVSGLSGGELRDLRRCTVQISRVVNMTSKGKIASLLVYVVVGDPVKGLVGIGRGRGDQAGLAIEAAYYEAVLSMDAVNRYEDRTLWGQGKELVTKYGASIVSLRARPPGHGLQVPQSVHRILSACGIRDASAEINGSTHPINVMKACIQLLHGGANPPGFGTGRGGHAKRENRGSSMRSKDEIERTRGRYGVDVGLRV